MNNKKPKNSKCYFCKTYIFDNEEKGVTEDGDIAHKECLELYEKLEEQHKQDMDLMEY